MSRKWKVALGFAVLLALYVTSSILTRKYWVQSFRTPSMSMSPTILEGDYFLVDKHSYRQREPRRGEVVAYQTDGEIFISRVIGMPGDRVELRDGVLSIDGEVVREQPTSDTVAVGSKKLQLPVTRQSLGGVTFLITRLPDAVERGFEPRVVAPDHYLLLSDFRNNAMDSRFKGDIERATLLGPVTSIYFSVDPAGGVRWDRIGHNTYAP